MHTRLLIAIAVSGVVHAGAFVVGSGFYDDFAASLNDTEPTITLTVSVVSSREPDLSRPSGQDNGSSEKQNPSPQREFVASRTVSKLSSSPEPLSGQVGKPAAGQGTATVAEMSPVSRKEEPPTARKPRTPKTRSPDPKARVQSPPMPGKQFAAIQALGEKHGEAAEQRYLTDFLTELSRHKFYPRSARLGRQEGKVVVSLVLLKDGSIEHVRVEKPSRFSVLNRAAVKAVERVRKFKPFPPGLQRDSWQLSVPFQYSITNP